jgi:hypothetical protein
LQVVLNQWFEKLSLFKIFITNGLRVKYSSQTSYAVAMEKPRLCRGLFLLCIQYSGWSITDTPRECAGLARVFVFLGLDRIFDPVPIAIKAYDDFPYGVETANADSLRE